MLKRSCFTYHFFSRLSMPRLENIKYCLRILLFHYSEQLNRIRKINICGDLNMKTIFHSLSSNKKQGILFFSITILCSTITACDLSSEERQQYFSWASAQTTIWQEQPIDEQDYRSCNSTTIPCQVITDVSTPKKGVSNGH